MRPREYVHINKFGLLADFLSTCCIHSTGHIYGSIFLKIGRNMQTMLKMQIMQILDELFGVEHQSTLTFLFETVCYFNMEILFLHISDLAVWLFLF